MEKYLSTPVKEMIGRFPAVGDILEEAGIGCVPCSVGTCLLSDIVEIHNLSPEDEAALLTRIAAVVAPGGTLVLPERKRDRTPRPKTITYSPPLKRLVDEHKLIKRYVTLIPEIVQEVDMHSEQDRRMILEGIDFIRSYADRYHHAKEEDILFAFFDPALDILQAMHEDHRRGRAHVQGLLEALERKDREGVVTHLEGYAGILTDHIRKEDEILYPFLDRNLSTRQVGEMFSRFREVDERFGDAQTKYEDFIGRLERKFPARSAEVVR